MREATFLTIVTRYQEYIESCTELSYSGDMFDTADWVELYTADIDEALRQYTDDVENQAFTSVPAFE